MTLRDAIIRAGGLRRTADPTIEIARFATPEEREAGQTARIMKVRVDSTYFVSDEAATFYLGDPGALASAVGRGDAATFALQPNDRILVRTIPNFQVPRVVIVRGEVLHPAAYTLTGREERLRDVLVARAGGLTANAYPAGFQLLRDSSIVDVDLPAVLRNPRHRDNIVLLPGDILTVPELNPVVTVRGAVNSPASVLYRPGAPLSYYIANAGGYARSADRGRTHVRYANGRGATVRRAGLFRSSPQMEPGAVVVVPFTPPDERTDVRGAITDIVQIAASVATVVLAITRLR
jgi:polysaccharide biosynthesis/export protein